MSEDLNSCTLAVGVKILGGSNVISSAHVTLRDLEGNIIKHEEDVNVGIAEGKNTEIIRWQFKKDEVQLWWPTGYGEQMLYEVEVLLLGGVSRLPKPSDLEL